MINGYTTTEKQEEKSLQLSWNYPLIILPAMVAILDEGSFQWMIHQTLRILKDGVLEWLEENGLD